MNIVKHLKLFLYQCKIIQSNLSENHQDDGLGRYKQ